MNSSLPLGDIPTLLQHYAKGILTPVHLIHAIHAMMEHDPDHAWTYRLPIETLQGYAEALEARAAEMERLPLYGVPFAIKDNIDLAGTPTTAGCPDFSYLPERNATVVQRLIDAGAIPVGKSNLDQFATGLNGTRSPYGACRNAFNPDYISGGSSSGSAVAVAKGMVCFSLGTDTAGSGRVPAAFNNIIGYKPTKGWLSTRGVVPACRSLDCVSIFTLTAADAERVLNVAAGYDSEDIYSRDREAREGFGISSFSLRVVVPRPEQLQFFGNSQAARLFDAAVARLRSMGAEVIEADFTPFLEAARLLYEGPWVAERYAAIQQFFDAHSDRIISPVREIIGSGQSHAAADVYKGMYRLRELKQLADRVWEKADCMLTPTAGTIYTVAAMQQDPVRLNSNLGYYTNFMNLLDYAAVAVPAGFQEDGLPFGITLLAPAHQDESLLRLAGCLQHAYALPLGATGLPLAERGAQSSGALTLPGQGRIKVAVCGAHLSGLPLNGQLTSRGGRLVATTTTSDCYRLYALPGQPPLRPGLIRVEKNERGTAIEVEVWELPVREFGSFVAGIPAPLGIGTIELVDGSAVQGFLCERYAAAGAEDISRFGGWRRYLSDQAAP